MSAYAALPPFQPFQGAGFAGVADNRADTLTVDVHMLGDAVRAGVLADVHKVSVSVLAP